MRSAHGDKPSNEGNRGSWAAGIASGFVLLLLVVGVPLLLGSQGAVPRVGELSSLVFHPRMLLDRLRGPLSDTALGGLVVLVAWAAWVYLAFCVLLDLVARARGRMPGRIPGSRVPQAMVAGLVGASLALLPSPRTSHMRLQPGLVVPAVPHARPPTSIRLPGSSMPSDVDSRPAPDPVASADPEYVGRAYVVRPGDTLWAIAERELGSPLLWRTIGDLNRGLPQPGGGALSDDNWLLPGWKLLLPSGSTESPTPTAPPTATPTTPPPATATDTTTAVATVQTASELPVVRGANGHVRSGSSAPAAVHTDGRSQGPRLPVVPVGFGILGAGVITLLSRMRRAQQRRRPEGLRVSLPDAELSELEQGLRVAADVPLLRHVDRALRLLRTVVQASGSSIPPIVGAQCTQDAVEFVLEPGAAAGPAPSPFTSEDGDRWRLSCQLLRSGRFPEPDGLLADDATIPTLVTVGADEVSTWLVDLERVGSLSISGRDASMMLQSIVVELCTLPWSDSVDIVVVGHHSKMGSLERARRSVSAAPLVPEIRRRIAAQGTLALENGSSRVSDARWASEDVCWDPMVVICFPEAVDAEFEAVGWLVELAGEGSGGVAVVVGAPVEGARWSVVVDGGLVELRGPMRSVGAAIWTAASLPSSGPQAPSSILAGATTLRTQPVPPDLLEKVDALVESAGASTWKQSGEPDEVSLLDPDDGHAEQVDAPEVRVLVLGPPQVTGAARPFARAWALELVVFLAMHRQGATTERWSSALWPDRLMAAPTLHSTASAARRALGVSATGEDHLPRAHGRLRLGPGVTSDWEEFQRLAASDVPADWEAALSLIKGRPFDGLRGADWIVLEGFMATIESAVVDLACRCARFHLGRDQPARAEAAARRALLVSEYDERLYRVLLVAADAAGNPAGVERAMEDLLRVVAEDVEPHDAVHPETLELYRSLSRRRRGGRGAAT